MTEMIIKKSNDGTFIPVCELVRCKDCMFRGDTDKCVVAFAAEKIGTPLFIADNHGEWFCADGKRKDGDQE